MYQRNRINGIKMKTFNPFCLKEGQRMHRQKRINNKQYEDTSLKHIWIIKLYHLMNLGNKIKLAEKFQPKSSSDMENNSK